MLKGLSLQKWDAPNCFKLPYFYHLGFLRSNEYDSFSFFWSSYLVLKVSLFFCVHTENHFYTQNKLVWNFMSDKSFILNNDKVYVDPKR